MDGRGSIERSARHRKVISGRNDAVAARGSLNNLE